MAILGLLGRFVHLSFDLLRHILMAVSLIVLLVYAVPKMRSMRFSFSVSAIQNLLSYWSLAWMTLLAGLISIQRVISDDDLSYIGYLTNIQNSPALNFNDIFFGVDKLSSVRFWLVSTPFSQAFLAATSRLSGVFVLGGYYEPFLVALSLICIYALARTLGLSQIKAMSAVTFQVLFLALLSEYLHPGDLFFTGLSADKATATFIVIPVFLQSLIWYFNKPSKENIILILLTGLSLMIMHPVILVFGVIVAGLMTVFGLDQANFRARAVLLVLLAAIMLPQIALRFVRSEAQGVIPYSIEEVLASSGLDSVVSVWGNTNFYGYNPAILAMHIPYADRIPINTLPLQYIWLVFPILGAALAIKQLRHDHLSQYVMAGFLLSVLAYIPFTGWILGAVVSAWMLERAPWLYPYGIGMTFFLITISDRTGLTTRLMKWTQPLQTRTKIDSAYWLLAALTVFSTILLWSFMREQNLPDSTRFRLNADRYTAFSQIGQFMDSHTSGQQTFVVGTDKLNDFIPSISSKAKLISFRPSDTSYPYFYSPQERNQRLLDRQAIFSRDVSMEERIQLIQKYHIQFLWLKEGEYYMVKSLVANFPDLFTENQIGGYYLIEVR